MDAQNSPAPVPAKMMCDVPRWPAFPEIWIPRYELVQSPSVLPIATLIDKVPILPT